VFSTGFLIGCINSRRVLSDEELERFAAAPSLTDLERLLVEYYGELKLHWRAQQLDAFIWHKYDAHNLKIILREKSTGLAQRQLLLPLGTLPLTTLAKIVDGQRPYLGPWDFIYNLSATETTTVAKTIDAFYYKHCLDQAKEHSLKFVAQTLIDIANVKKCVSREADYLPGGSRLVSWWNGQEDFTSLLGSLFHVEPKEEDLEQFLDEWLFTRVSAYRYATSGVMPLVLFFLRLELEVKNIKIKYLAKQKNFAELKELVRKAYV
jgi:vacuolar-type H+-ATPase subunit C/Vma6